MYESTDIERRQRVLDLVPLDVDWHLRNVLTAWARTRESLRQSLLCEIMRTGAIEDKGRVRGLQSGICGGAGSKQKRCKNSSQQPRPGTSQNFQSILPELITRENMKDSYISTLQFSRNYIFAIFNHRLCADGLVALSPGRIRFAPALSGHLSAFLSGSRISINH
jgi:hypothetical protein